jgi:hypothetical protein
LIQIIQITTTESTTASRKSFYDLRKVKKLKSSALQLVRHPFMFNDEKARLCRIRDKTMRAQTRLEETFRYAAIILLVLIIAGATITVFPHPHPAQNPLKQDWDGDGLCSDCESEIFGTDLGLADTDGNGTPDGREDHNGDGILNIKELEKMVSLLDALEKGDVKTVEELLEYSSYIPFIHWSGTLALNLAAQYGHTEIVRILLDEGDDVNTKDEHGDTALIYAANNGHLEVVELLLQAGANMNAAQDAALKGAAIRGHTETVRLLLEEGADVNVQFENGWTALMWAAQNGHVKTVKLLLQKGADIDARDNNGRTALMKAIEGNPFVMTLYWIWKRNRNKVIEYLLDAGASVNLKYNDGMTALMIAKTTNETHIIDLLIEAGAKE